MRFPVPQFIDVEDKLFGQLTLRQGLYIVGSIGFTVAIFLNFGLLYAILFGGPVLFLAFLLSFIKIHGRPFSYIFYSASLYAFKHKLYLWKQTPKKVSRPASIPTNTLTQPSTSGIPRSKLKELALSLDAKEPFDTEKKQETYVKKFTKR